MDSHIQEILKKENWDIFNNKHPKLSPGTLEASDGQKSFMITMKELFDEEEDICINIHPRGTYCAPIPHYHDFYEIPFVYSGKVYHKIGDELLIQDADHLLCLNIDTIHNIWSNDGDTIVFNLLIRPSCMQNCMLPFIRTNRLFYSFFQPEQSYEENGKSNFLLLELSKSARSLMIDIIFEYYAKQEFEQEILRAQCLQLFCQLSRDQHNFSSQYEKEPVVDILNYIRIHSAHVSLQDVADHFGYSTRHISRMISQKTNQNFREWVLDFKLENACQLLLNTDMPIHIIIEQTGFHSPSAFYHIFHDKIGMSAREYRNLRK